MTFQAGGRARRALNGPGAQGGPWANEKPEIDRLTAGLFSPTAVNCSGVGSFVRLQQSSAERAEARDGGTAPKEARCWVGMAVRQEKKRFDNNNAQQCLVSRREIGCVKRTNAVWVKQSLALSDLFLSQKVNEKRSGRRARERKRNDGKPAELSLLHTKPKTGFETNQSRDLMQINI